MSEGKATSYRCNRCDRYWAEGALKQIRAGSGFVTACPTCGDLVHEEASRVARPLPTLLAGAFIYPFRGSTVLWAIGLLVVTTFLRFVPLVGGLLAISAELGFLFAVLRSSAAGESELRVEASDIADFTSWFGPLFKYLAAFALSFGPAIFLAILLSQNRNEASTLLIIYGAGGLGLLYFPAALVVAAHSEGCLGVLNPVAGVTFISRIPGPYAITLAFLSLAVAAGAGMLTTAAAIDIPIVGLIARSIASLYAPLVGMRMLGLLMEEHAEEL